MMLSISHTNREPTQAADRCCSSSTASLLLRGQAAVELLAYAAFFLLVFVTAVVVFLQVQTQELTRSENVYAQEIAYGFADNIHTAFVAGPGFVESVNVPKDILGRRYWLRVSNSSDASKQETGIVYVDWTDTGKNTSFSAPTVTTNYNFTRDPENVVTVHDNFIVIDTYKNQKINISNVNGTITIQKG